MLNLHGKTQGLREPITLSRELNFCNLPLPTSRSNLGLDGMIQSDCTNYFVDWMPKAYVQKKKKHLL